MGDMYLRGEGVTAEQGTAFLLHTTPDQFAQSAAIACPKILIIYKSM